MVYRDDEGQQAQIDSSEKNPSTNWPITPANVTPAGLYALPCRCASGLNKFINDKCDLLDLIHEVHELGR